MFGQFVAWCGKTDSCALHGQDIPRRWDALLTAADQGNLYDGAGELTDADRAIGTAGGGLSSLTWPYLAEWINAATIGKPAQGATLTSAPSAAPPVPLVRNPEGVFCEDWDAGLGTFADYRRVDRDSRAAAPHMRYDPNMREALLGCAGSPRPLPLNNPPSDWRPDPAGPVIVIANSRYDSKTSHAWAESLLKQGGKKAVLLTYEGWGHNTYTHSPCNKAAIDAYLLGKRTPEPGASCPAPSTGPIVPQPNTQSFDGPGQANRPDQGDW
jgi:hypothetical protein